MTAQNMTNSPNCVAEESDNEIKNYELHSGARGRIRTCIAFRPHAPKACESTVPPLGQI